MATIDTRLVRNELAIIRDTSQGVSKLLRKRLEQIQSNPSAFSPLEIVPDRIAALSNVVIRKAKITLGKHDFRLVFAHRTLDDGSEHVDALLAFRRKRGYEIDWDCVADALG